MPQVNIDKNTIQQGLGIMDLLTDKSDIFSSKGELKRMIKGGGVSINKEKITDLEINITEDYLINSKYILIQKGKKNYYLIKTI